MTSESVIQRQIRVDLGLQPDLRLFRNNVGEAWLGRVVGHASRSRVVLLNPARVVYGLERGSSDLIGWRSFVITAEHVGLRVAVFTSVEVKKPGETPDDQQRNWIDRVNAAGGIAGAVKSSNEARKLCGLGPAS